jgi:DnaJ-class molecular chaperone
VAEEPYAVLGVARGAPFAEVRKVYRKLAKELHPDANPNNKAAEERFKRVSAAFTFLDDPERKAKYDRGEIDADGNPKFAGFSGSAGGRGPFAGAGRRQTGPGQPEFEDMFGDLFGAAFGARGGARPGFQAGTKGQDIQTTITIDFEDAISGAKQRVKAGDRSIDVTIPAGVETGRTLRLRGQGGPGQGGMPAGDLMVTVTVKPHPVFNRDGDDVRMDLPVSLTEILEGGRVEADIPNGTVSLTIPPSSNSGTVLRLKGKGVARPGAPGDLFVRLILGLPEGDNGELKALLATWSRRDEPPKR